MNFPLYIAKRYLRSKSSNNAINIIAYIAMLGIVLGSASLFVVLSGFAGLKDYTLEFSSVIDPDLKAEVTVGKSFVVSPETEEKLRHIEGIASFSKVIEEQIIVTYDGKNYPARIKGVDAYFEDINDVNAIMEQGSWFGQEGDQIVTGWGIANTLSIGVLDYGKTVKLSAPKPGKGQISSIREAFYTALAVNTGIFHINESMNDTYVYAPIHMAKRLVKYEEGAVSALEFGLKEGFDESDVKPQIQAVLGENVMLKNRAQLNDSLYKMLNTENLVVYLIFTLVIIIALFNVIGSIIMMILDKRQNMNTLYNLGATLKDIRKIFFLQGSLMTIFGGLLGVLIGFAVVVLQKTFSLVMLTPTLPYPMNIKPENFVIVFLTISVFGVLASKLASVRISRTLVEEH